MYFRLSIFPGRSDLLAVVASDGNVYWKGYDIGRFLGYCNAYQFANKYAKDLKSLIPFEHKKVRFFTFEEMLDVMKRVRYSLKDIDKFVTLYSNGMVEDVSLTNRLNSKTCPRLIVTKDKGSIRLQDWIKKYVNSSIEYFNQLKMLIESSKATNLKIKNESNTNEEPQSLTAESETVNGMNFPPVIHMEEELGAQEGNEAALNNNEIITDGVFQIAFDGMQVPEEILLNINGQVYAYVKAFTHLKESR